MGVSASRRLTRDQRKERDRRRQEKIRQTLEHHERSLPVEGTPVTSVTHYRALREKEIGHQQLLRGDRSFTKTDLVAILIRLRGLQGPDTPDPVDIYHALTIPDLIVLIREELYSPPKTTHETRELVRL